MGFYPGIKLIINWGKNIYKHRIKEKILSKNKTYHITSFKQGLT